MPSTKEQTLAATKLFLSLTRIDFATVVSSRAVRISSRAVRVFPALSLRCVRPSYGTFPLIVFQGNCARGHTGHMIHVNYLIYYLHSLFVFFLQILVFKFISQLQKTGTKTESCGNLLKIRLEWISQSNESIGRLLGFVIDRLFNTSASLYRIAPCLRACVLVICLHVFLYMYMYMLQSVWWKLILKLHVHVCKIVVTTC